jgi:ketosteroid isomerase-like protein
MLYATPGSWQKYGAFACIRPSAREGQANDAAAYMGSIEMRSFIAVLLLAAMLAFGAPARAQSAAQNQIRAALENWTAQFNAGNAGATCDLFAPDLIADYRGQPERDYDSQCALLHKALSDRSRKFHNSLEIKEIIVSGDLAVVRLVWTAEIKQINPPRTQTVQEPGLDVFRRQPDGTWKIARYLAYPATR